VAVAKVAADINYDVMAPLEVWGKLGFVFDFGFDQSDLNDVVRGVAEASGIAIFPDPDPAAEFFTRSDNYAFAQQGIPALFLVGGPAMTPRILNQAGEWEATRYHMPRDLVQLDWDWEGARMLAAFGLVTGMRIANQQAMPSWKPGSPYKRQVN
jgi:Zn-dependent M28 family amino/carboxypeptidase